MVDSKVIPNFLIVGAPKCGTTALSEYLRLHPNIFLSDAKEPHYFADDFVGHRSIASLDQYLSLFAARAVSQTVVGEASVWYLYSKTAVRNINRYNVNAKIIVMLRNPVELVQSLHSQLIYSFYEDEKEFQRAWELQVERKKGYCLPPRCLEPAFLQYAEIGKLGDQVERLLQVIPRRQVKIIVFEDFVRATRQVYEDVLMFLNVPLDGRTDFPSINIRRRHISRLVGRLVQRPSPALVAAAKRSKEFFGLERLGVLDKLQEANTRYYKHPVLGAEFRRELAATFGDDVLKLGQVLNRDLTYWLSQ